MSDSSGYGNKPSIQPDVSPKRKEKFSYRDAGAAIVIIIIVVVATILLTVGFRNNYETDLEKATAEAETIKADFNAKLLALAEREKDLKKREDALAVREAALKTGQAELETAQADLENSQSILASDMQNFTTEEEEFFNKQLRIKELCDALSLELTPEE